MKRYFSFLKEYIDKDRAYKIEGPLAIFDDVSSIENMPDKKGIYFIASRKHRFVYPNGNSPIIYIGKADNLRKRLMGHSREARNAKETRKTQWVYSRYNYIMMDGGADVYFLTTITNENPKGLESRALEDFYNKYWALPVGNGAFSYRSK